MQNCIKIDFIISWTIKADKAKIRLRTGMSFCINIKTIDLKKAIIGKTTDYQAGSNTVALNKFFYSYDTNISSELKLLTGFINVTRFYKFGDKLVFIVESAELRTIMDNLNSLEGLESSEKLEDLEKKAEDNTVRLYFKNNISKLNLSPTKKSNLAPYILTKIENENQVRKYYPQINKYGIEGNFILKILVVNHKVKFIIQSGDLKHPMSFIKHNNSTKNIYDTKIVIDI